MLEVPVEKWPEALWQSESPVVHHASDKARVIEKAREFWGEGFVVGWSEQVKSWVAAELVPGNERLDEEG